MKKITLTKYNNIPADYRGVYSNPERPELIGHRTMLDYDPQHGTVLLIEGNGFEIIEEGKT